MTFRVEYTLVCCQTAAVYTAGDVYTIAWSRCNAYTGDLGRKANLKPYFML